MPEGQIEALRLKPPRFDERARDFHAVSREIHAPDSCSGFARWWRTL